MEKKNRTIASYNEHARSLAEKFDDLGERARVPDIEEAFALLQKINPRVLEIGSGNGRDAKEITKRTGDYLGIDISEKLVDLARQKVPQGKFEVADVETYRFQKGVDIIFAFASLIHVPKESLRRILNEASEALNEGGGLLSFDEIRR